MKILVLSDSHGRIHNMKLALTRTDCDMVFHLGDSELSREELERLFSCPVLMVRGNMDRDMSYKIEETFDISGHRFLLSHGNRLGVNYGYEGLLEEAAKVHADVVLFGHTHIPELKYYKENDLYIANPGSIEMPRQDGRKPSYLVIDAEEDGILSFKEMYL